MSLKQQHSSLELNLVDCDGEVVGTFAISRRERVETQKRSFTDAFDDLSARRGVHHLELLTAADRREQDPPAREESGVDNDLACTRSVTALNKDHIFRFHNRYLF